MKHALLNLEFGKPETIGVLGVGRGGTSAVAGALRSLGICMGNDPHPQKHEWSPVAYGEDRLVDAAITAANVRAMDEANKIWGWKSPIDIFALDQIIALLRNPGFIVVTRDLLEVALSTERYVDTPIELGLYETATIYNLIADRLRFWPCPILLVSYSELTANPESFISLVVEFLGLECEPSISKAAADFIVAGANTYRQVKADAEVGLSTAELALNRNGSVPYLNERYASDYLHHFEVLYQDALRAVDFLFAPPARDADATIAQEVADSVGRIAARAEPGEQGGPAPSSEEPRKALENALQSLHRGAFGIQEAMRELQYDLPDGFRLLRRLRFILQLLVLARMYLQKGLERRRTSRPVGYPPLAQP